MYLKKPVLILTFLFSTFSFLAAQTLFEIGHHPVSVQEFLKAYHRQHTSSAHQVQSQKEYLELYIPYRLKLQEAYDQGIDSLFSVQTELSNYRESLMHQFRYDESTFQKLLSEAKERSKTDISLSYIMVYKDESATALNKIQSAHNALEKGEEWSEVVNRFSEDTATLRNGGAIGMITVFNLPYALESVVYALRDQQYSAPVAHGNAYYIFKRNASREAVGNIQVQQILLLYPGERNPYYRDSLFRKAADIYDALTRGASFDSLAKIYNNDPRLIQTGGLIPEFGIGKYDLAFEEKAFGLKKDGDITPPFETAFGVHILKRKKLEQTYKNASAEYWTGLIENNDRIAVAYAAMQERMNRQLQLKKASIPDLDTLQQHWYQTVLQNQPVKDSMMVLATFADQRVYLYEWTGFLKRYAVNRAALSAADLNKLYDQYLAQRAQSHYRQYIEKFEPAFADRLNEYKEGIMLFESMQQKVWQTVDSVTLKNFYQERMEEFIWKPYVKMIYLSALTNENINAVIESVKTIEDMRQLTSNDLYLIFNTKEEADQLSFLNGEPPVAGKLYPVMQDGIQMLYGIESVHQGGEPKTFDEAQMDVMTAYQKKLDDDWVASLRKKYPVKINKKMFKKLNRL